MSRREQFLNEMGLGPVWFLRTRAEQETTQETGRAIHPAMPDDAGMDALPRAAITAGGGAIPGLKEGDSHPGAGALQSLAAGDERSARIAGMDWAELRQAVTGCQACALHATRRNTVFGSGDERAEWMIVGEAPGAEEDARGEPFVGQAGKLLDNMLAAIGLIRGKNVYIANVLKCRPPGNRNPEPREVAQCAHHLVRQVALVQPKLILAMGRFAAQTLLDTEASISSLRGRVHRYQGVPTVVTYHPAYLLRTLPDKAKAWADLCLARHTLSAAAG